MSPAVSTSTAKATPSVWTASYNARMRATLVATVCLAPVVTHLSAPLEVPDEVNQRPLTEDTYGAYTDALDDVQEADDVACRLSRADEAVLRKFLEIKQHGAVTMLALWGPTAEDLTAICLACDPPQVSLGVARCRTAEELTALQATPGYESPAVETSITAGDYMARVGVKKLEDLSLRQRQELLLWMFDSAGEGPSAGKRFADVRVALGLPRDYLCGALAFVGEPTDPFDIGDGTLIMFAARPGEVQQ